MPRPPQPTNHPVALAVKIVCMGLPKVDRGQSLKCHFRYAVLAASLQIPSAPCPHPFALSCPHALCRATIESQQVEATQLNYKVQSLERQVASYKTALAKLETTAQKQQLQEERYVDLQHPNISDYPLHPHHAHHLYTPPIHMAPAVPATGDCVASFQPFAMLLG